MKEDRLLTKKQVQEYLQISHTFLQKLMNEKELPYIKLGRRVLFQKSDLDKLLETKKVK